MNKARKLTRSVRLLLAAPLGLLVGSSVMTTNAANTALVSGGPISDLMVALNTVNGELISKMSHVGLISARLTAEQQSMLRRAGYRVTPDRQLSIAAHQSSGALKQVRAEFAKWTGAASLHAAGIDGRNVGVAFVDTGIWSQAAKRTNFKAWVDTTGSSTGDAVDGRRAWQHAEDPSGHGTHISSIVGSHLQNHEGEYLSIAPGADLLMVRAFGAEGAGSYLDVIEAINWVVAHKDEYNIRVLNLSFGAEPVSYYWEDPVNQAAMAAWNAGIVVVASAGNTGPDPMTIAVPGNLPYLITVGAASDNYTVDDSSDDFLTHFSSAGPTLEGFVKPEIIAPGDRLIAQMAPASETAKSRYGKNSSDKLPATLYAMSGTSQSAAVVSGVAALMIQAEPDLTPDDIKCRLMDSARAAITETGSPHYSIFQQGAGLVDATAAVNNTSFGCANVGLDVQAELRGEQHFRGLAELDENGEFYLRDPNADGQRIETDGYTWGGNYSFSLGYTWGGQNLMNNGYTWGGHYGFSQGYTWGGQNVAVNGYTWGGHYGVQLGYTWGGQNNKVMGYTWGGYGFAVSEHAAQRLHASSPISTNRWIAPEAARRKD